MTDIGDGKHWKRKKRFRDPHFRCGPRQSGRDRNGCGVQYKVETCEEYEMQKRFVFRLCFTGRRWMIARSLVEEERVHYVHDVELLDLLEIKDKLQTANGQ